jgi:hypothetical protein
MKTFKEFMQELKNSSATALPSADSLVSTVESAMNLAVSASLSPVPSSDEDKENLGKKQEFVEKVTNFIHDDQFISDLSDRIGLPSPAETEDEFVARGSDALKKMLYARFGIKE